MCKKPAVVKSDIHGSKKEQKTCCGDFARYVRSTIAYGPLLRFSDIIRILIGPNDFHFEGLEDDEVVSDVLEKSVHLQAQFTGLKFTDGKIRINVEQSIVGDVGILMGDLKSFEHYLLNVENNTIKLPNGNV